MSELSVTIVKFCKPIKWDVQLYNWNYILVEAASLLPTYLSVDHNIITIIVAEKLRNITVMLNPWDWTHRIKHSRAGNNNFVLHSTAYSRVSLNVLFYLLNNIYTGTSRLASAREPWLTKIVKCAVENAQINIRGTCIRH